MLKTIFCDSFRQQSTPTRVHHLTVSSIKPLPQPSAPVLPPPLQRSQGVFYGFTTANTIQIPYATIAPNHFPFKIQTLTRLKDSGEYEIFDGATPPEKIKVSSPDLEMTAATAIDAIKKAFITDGNFELNEKPQSTPQMFRPDEKTLEQLGIPSFNQSPSKQSNPRFVKLSTLQNVLGIKTLPGLTNIKTDEKLEPKWDEDDPASSSPAHEEIITITDTEEVALTPKSCRRKQGAENKDSDTKPATTKKRKKKATRKRWGKRKSTSRRTAPKTKKSPSKRSTETPTRDERETPTRDERATPTRDERATPTRDEKPDLPIDYQSPLDSLYDRSPTSRKSPYECISSNLIKIGREETVETAAAIREQEMSKLLKIRSLNRMLNERVPGAGLQGTKVLVEYLRNACNSNKQNVLDAFSKSGTVSQKKRVQFQVNGIDLGEIPEDVPETSKKIVTERILVNLQDEDIQKLKASEVKNDKQISSAKPAEVQNVDDQEEKGRRTKSKEKLKNKMAKKAEITSPWWLLKTKRGTKKRFGARAKIKDESNDKRQGGKIKRVAGKLKKRQIQLLDDLKPELPPIDDDIQQIFHGVAHQTADFSSVEGRC